MYELRIGWLQIKEINKVNIEEDLPFGASSHLYSKGGTVSIHLILVFPLNSILIILRWFFIFISIAYQGPFYILLGIVKDATNYSNMFKTGRLGRVSYNTQG